MCVSIAHNTHQSNIISLNKLTQAIVSALKHLPINGYMCGRPIMLQGSLYKVTCLRTYKGLGLQQFLESLGVTPLTQLYHQALWNESHTRCHWGTREEWESVCSTGTADHFLSLLLLGKTGSWLPETIHIALCQRASQKHVIMHVMSLQDHICKAWRMFVFPNVNYWVILCIWDRLYSLPREFLWITITIR